MSVSKHHRPAWTRLLGGFGLIAAVSAIGCQSDIGGQTLPSPYWQTDDVQYFPPGPEFKLSREAAAMKSYKNEQLRAGKQPVPVVPGEMPPGMAPVPAAIPPGGIPPGAVPPDAAP